MLSKCPILSDSGQTSRATKTMTITTSNGTMNLADDAKPSIDDMNDIISHYTSSEDNGVQFQALCDASVDFPSNTNSEFAAACEKWVAARRA